MRAIPAALSFLVFSAASCPAGASDPDPLRFWAPADPPRSHNWVACTINPDESTFEGMQQIRFTNNTDRPIRRLILSWDVVDGTDRSRELEITQEGRPVRVIDDAGPVVFDLPHPISPSARCDLNVRFKVDGWPRFRDGADEIIASRFLPRLDWGFPVHEDYDVQMIVPPDYEVALSAAKDAETGGYQARNVRAFGIYLGKAHRTMEARSGDIVVRVVFREAALRCAKLLLETAVDAIKFYRDRFGFYPQEFLNIVPGMDSPAGGYPVASGIVVIHGQQQMAKRDALHWKWITAHEIGHQYWGEHVLEKDDPSWVWIGMGVYADLLYTRARGLAPDKHHGMMKRYIDGVREGHDTTLAITSEQHARVSFDWNNVVKHGKGYSVISALAFYLGEKTFDRILRKGLKDYAGRRFGADELQRLSEQASGEDLAWFFDQWVRTDRYLAYEITSQETKKPGNAFVTTVAVRRVGDLVMPVPVVALFEDGSQQRKRTDRLFEHNVLTFESKSPVREIAIDPDHELAMVLPPPPGKIAQQIIRSIRDLSYTGEGDDAVKLFEKAEQAKLQDTGTWVKLGMCLYDGEHYPPALVAFERAGKFAEEGRIWGFVSLVWQGQILDLLDRREEALGRYRRAVEKDTGATMRHDQYRMQINRAWIEQRLETPFRRK